MPGLLASTQLQQVLQQNNNATQNHERAMLVPSKVGSDFVASSWRRIGSGLCAQKTESCCEALASAAMSS
jgi:hypothetical protein